MKSNNKKIISCNLYEGDFSINIPSVMVEDEPKIKIYDADGKSYWFIRIGFNRRITDEN